ncbi:hypothetical protein [Ruegeria atlantica]|uniref:hypothetical protein n=1 Tax=Ruegeria atlantica TaxID=81569 RepID=UPI00147C4215|nr:hypothetical protein [Ruegeria atlantica]
MKKTLITSVTAFALILSAGMSSAHPSIGHGHNGHAQHLSPATSPTDNFADTTADYHQANKVPANAATGEQPTTLSSKGPGGSYQWSRDYSVFQ